MWEKDRKRKMDPESYEAHRYLTNIYCDTRTKGIDSMSIQNWATGKFGQTSPVRRRFTPMSILFQLDDMKVIVREYRKALEHAYPTSDSAKKFDFDKFAHYVQTLIVLRIDQVTSARKFRDWDRRVLAVPNFVAGYLLGIGEIKDQTYGYKLTPTYDPNFKPMPFKDMKELSDELYFFEHAFKPVKFPTVTDGDIEFMSKFFLNDMIVSYRGRDHVYSAFLAAIIKKIIADDVVEAILEHSSSYEYGNSDVFREKVPVTEAHDESGNLGTPNDQG